MARSNPNMSPDSLFCFYFRFYSNSHFAPHLSYFSQSDYTYFTDSSRLVFHSARDGLLFRFLTDLPVEISVDPELYSHLFPPVSFDPTPSPTISNPVDLTATSDFHSVPNAQEYDPWPCNSSVPSESSSGTVISPTPPPTARIATSQGALCPSLYSGPVSVCTFHYDYIDPHHWGYDSDVTVAPDSELFNLVDVEGLGPVPEVVSPDSSMSDEVIVVSSDSDC